MAVTDEDWLPQQAGILKIWGEVCAVYRYLHFISFKKFKKLNMRFTLPIIIISTLTGTANFAQGTFPANMQSTVPLVIGGLNLVAAIATTISQFLKVNELMEAHRVAAGIYGKMSRHIRLELCLPPSERSVSGHEFINVTKLELDRLVEQSPAIPGDVLRLFEKKFPKKTYHFARPEILDIREITPYSEELNDKLNSSSAERIKKAAMGFFSTKTQSGRNYDEMPDGTESPFNTPPTYEELQVSQALQSLRLTTEVETPPPSPRLESDEENSV